MANKDDRRVLYTKMFLREALLTLMKEKPVDRITPTELCRTAGINRNTFYSHYYTVRELLESIEKDLEEQIMKSLSEKMPNGTVFEILNEICEIMLQQKDLCVILLSDNGDSAFLEKAIAIGKNIALSKWHKAGMKLSDETADIVLGFMVAGSLSVMKRWAQSDMRQSPRQIAEMIERISYGGVSAFELKIDSDLTPI